MTSAANCDDTPDGVAGRIRRLRKDRAWSQIDLAVECGVARFTVTRWEAAERLPMMSACIRLADAFGVSLDYLIRGIS